MTRSIFNIFICQKPIWFDFFSINKYSMNNNRVYSSMAVYDIKCYDTNVKYIPNFWEKIIIKTNAIFILILFNYFMIIFKYKIKNMHIYNTINI